MRTYTLFPRFDVANLVLLKIFDTFRDPPHGVFDTPRNIAVRLMWSDGHEHVGEVLYSDSKICFGTIRPNITEGNVVHTTEVNGFERTSD